MQRPVRPRTSRYGVVWRVVAALLMIVVVLAAVAIGRAPSWLGLYYLGLGVLSAGTYYYDKRQAIAEGWRVPEMTLHGLDLVGGVIGGLLAQVAWRHKTAKPGFGFATALIVIVQLSALGAIISDSYNLGSFA